MILPEKLILWFLPARVRHDKTHPSFYEMYSLVCICLFGIAAMSAIPAVLHYFRLGSHLWTYYLNVLTIFTTLFSLRYTGYWRLPNFFCGIVAYGIIYTWLADTGLMYSSNICMVHIYLISALLVDRKFGWYGIFSNLLFLGLIYYQTNSEPALAKLSGQLGSPFYAFLMQAVITAFMGGFLAYGLRNQENSRKRIKSLQDQQIALLDEAVRKRTEQLNSMRQTIATDFHDQTGNMLAAINRQASMLELKLHSYPDLLPFVRSIISNSNELYASSKDFLWTLNHDSDNPQTLFQYLTAYGQNFYNQFDISFSADCSGAQPAAGQLDPFAAMNLIYIFKEAMTNVIKHSDAREVSITMGCSAYKVYYTLADNGRWKNREPSAAHYGLENMERRARQSGFAYGLDKDDTGTRITISMPLSLYVVKNEEK